MPFCLAQPCLVLKARGPRRLPREPEQKLAGPALLSCTGHAAAGGAVRLQTRGADGAEASSLPCETHPEGPMQEPSSWLR